MSSTIHTETIIAPIEDFVLFKMSGTDCESFLHGQFTADIIGLEKGKSCITAWCNPKGQVICTLLLIKTGNDILLLLRSDQKDYLLKRLNMFILRADVVIEDISDKHLLFGANTIIDTIPDTVTRFLFPDNQHCLYLTDDNSQLDDSIQTALPAAWHRLMIQAGIPWVSEVNREKFLPQMLNLDNLEGLSYQKGCYPGQEVIARLHYRGEVKRRLHLVYCQHELHEGASIKTVNNEKVGTVINAEKDTGQYIALAVIDLDKTGHALIAESDATIQIINSA